MSSVYGKKRHRQGCDTRRSCPPKRNSVDPNRNLNSVLSFRPKCPADATTGGPRGKPIGGGHQNHWTISSSHLTNPTTTKSPASGTLQFSDTNMKIQVSPAALVALVAGSIPPHAAAQADRMVKMCLFYSAPSGHARSDPIISQDCTSSHMHTFYGPRSIHPSTSYDDLRATPPDLSTTPYEENQSLYWHPSIYRVVNGEYILVRNLDSSPYYRWDLSVDPVAEPFPPGFRMIAASDDPGADGCGPDGNCGSDSLHAMFTECCMLRNGSETCEAWEQSQIVFPTRSCDFLGIALAMPTCWDGRIDSPDHKSHMAYTVGGNVADPCPPGYDRRLPQVQLFVRINNYRGGTYVLSDLKDTFHVDFFNGWEEGKLQTIMNTCQPQPQGVNEYNPPCDCTPESLEDEGTYDGGLTSNEASAQICDSDIKRMIVDEDFDQISTLPVYGGSCQGEPMIERTWPTGLTADLFSTDCNNPITTTSTSSTTGSTTTTRSQTTTRAPPSTTTTRETSTASTTGQTTTTTQSPPRTTTGITTTSSSTTEAPPEEEDLRVIACGSGERRLRCPEDVDVADASDVHGVRCCRDCANDGPCSDIWRRKCGKFDDEVFGTSYVGTLEECAHEATFYEALELCEEMEGGRLCTADEVIQGCTKGTGCGLNSEMVWTCMYLDGDCESDMECCSGFCNGGACDEE